MPLGSNEEIEYTQEKPQAQECPICLDEVHADDKTSNGIPNCVTCKNAHYLHRECYDKMTNNKCPICREDVKYNCLGYRGYIKPNRKGGKRSAKKRSKKNKKSHKQSGKKRSKKSKKNKTRKSRRTRK